MSTESKVQALQKRAQQAYDDETPDRDKVQAWFNALPEADLGVLWGLACSEGVAYDDEVYEALSSRGWFDDDDDHEPEAPAELTESWDTGRGD